jgi:hypothetical protein
LPANAAVLVGGGERVNNHNSPNRAEWYNPATRTRTDTYPLLIDRSGGVRTDPFTTKIFKKSLIFRAKTRIGITTSRNCDWVIERVALFFCPDAVAAA